MENLKSALLEKLVEDYNFTLGDNNNLSRGICPSCQQKELWGNSFFIKCNKLNNCAYEEKVRNLYPEFFTNFNARFSDEKEPKAIANAYMSMARGLPAERISHLYEQGSFTSLKSNVSTATVRFYLDNAKKIYMERFVEDIFVQDNHGEKTLRRANFKGPHSGLAWQDPNIKIKKEVVFVEGIIDAISLNLIGVPAVAILSCGNFPGGFLEKTAKNIKLIWALDNDRAGRSSIFKHIAVASELGFTNQTAALSPPGVDFNDVHKSGELNQKEFKNCLYKGSFLLCANERQAASLHYSKYKRENFYLDFKSQIFICRVEKAEKAEKTSKTDIKPVIKVTQVANFSFDFSYFQKHYVTGESHYYGQLAKTGASSEGAFAAYSITSATEFKKRAMSVCNGAVFFGTTKNLDALIAQKTAALPEVRALDFLGYDKKTAAYIFNNKAFWNNRVIHKNDRGYYQINKHFVTTSEKSENFIINEAGYYNPHWIIDLQDAFGYKGLVLLSFWIGSFFVEQIRSKQQSYPFLEVIGDAGAGKSSILEFLWRLSGRDNYEGFDPHKASFSAKGRNLAKYSNLPVVMIEADRGIDGVRFPWDEFKNAYNGGIIFSRGLKTPGNDTYEPPFKGALIISQNVEVVASPAFLERIVRLKFKAAENSGATRAAVRRLLSYKIEELSYFVELILKQGTTILKVYFREFNKAEEFLFKSKINHDRTIKNHAQILALLEVVLTLLAHNLDENQIRDLREQLRGYVVSMATRAANRVAKDDVLVRDFWDVYHYLEATDKTKINLSNDNQLIKINLNQFIEVAAAAKQQLPKLSDLKSALKTSKKYKYIANNKNVRGVAGVKKCWVFNNAEFNQTKLELEETNFNDHF